MCQLDGTAHSTNLLEQRGSLAAYAVDSELPAFLRPYQWTLIENMVTILDPCEQLTKDMSSVTATAADVIPAIEALKYLLKKTITTDHGDVRTAILLFAILTKQQKGKQQKCCWLTLQEMLKSQRRRKPRQMTQQCFPFDNV